MWFVAAMAAFGPVAFAATQSSSDKQEPASQSAFDQLRFDNLLSVLEGQNSPQARRTGARELLIQGWAEVTPRLVAILRGANQPARIAVAYALSDAPDRLTVEFIDPLFEMITEPEDDVRKAAALALAAGSSDDILARLKIMATSRDLPAPSRRSAIDTLGMMTQRDAVKILVELLTDPDPEISETALQMIEQMTAQDFYGDPEAALDWWQKAKLKPNAQWQRMQIERLIRQNRAREQRCRDLEQRLAVTMQDSYYRAGEAQRPALLSTYLTDTSVAVRKLGLVLVQAILAEGKTLPEDLIAQTRELMNATEPEVRAAAIQTVATLRNSIDADRFKNLLASEHNRNVRRALVNGLGYVGNAESLPMLLDLIQTPGSTVINESVTALGRLAERGILDSAGRKQVTDLIIAQYEGASHDNAVLRERLLWALSRLGDPRHAKIFVDCLNTAEPGPVRLAAIRGIATLVDPRKTKTNGNGTPATQSRDSPALNSTQLLDTLLPFVGDSSIEIRRAAVESLAQSAATEQQIAALWTRLDPNQESEEEIRLTAWRGAVRILAARPYGEIQAWLQRLPGDEKYRRQHTIELLQAAVTSSGTAPQTQNDLGPIRARLAAEYAATNQIDEALTNYLGALSALAASQPREVTRVAVELLRFAIQHGRYDGQLAAAIANCSPALDSAALWTGIRGEIENRLNPDEIDQTIETLAALQAHPPATMPAATQTAIGDLLQRARQIRRDNDAAVIAANLQKLKDNPNDPKRIEAILGLGNRAAPIVRETLRAALKAERPDNAWIVQLRDLLKSLEPDWTGFTPDATLEDKLNSLN
jgi:HEAT repeat protein